MDLGMNTYGIEMMSTMRHNDMLHEAETIRRFRATASERPPRPGVAALGGFLVRVGRAMQRQGRLRRA